MIEINKRDKVASIFKEPGIIVDKSMSRLNDQWKKLPSFTIDFLIAEMVDPLNPTPGLERINKLLNDHFMEADQKELVKSFIREKGEHTLIGRIRCRFNEREDQYWCDVAALGNQHIRIDPAIISEYGDILLTSGAWGTFTIIYDESFALRKKMYPFLISRFRPIQVTGINLDTWIKRRAQFDNEQWLDLMINSVGFNPDYLSHEEKILYMIRLIPFVEANINLVELGPPMTGKTYSYQSLSSHSFVISGGQTTVATLFFDKLRRQVGLIGYKDVVCFDEFANNRGINKWSGHGSIVEVLKDFMSSGKFSRGTAEFASDCSLVFTGNIDCDREKRTVSPRYRSLFAPLPYTFSQDRAFLDRIHGFLPGWRIGPICESNMSRSQAFMADYLSEIMHRMRSRSYGNIILQNVDFGRMGQRDQRSLVRIGSGLLKLLSPHKTVETITSEELKTVLDVATDLRQRVIDQLKIISPGEFSGVKLEYKIK